MNTALDLLMLFFSAMGEPPIWILGTAIICWCMHYTAGIKIIIYALFAGTINTFLKYSILAPRPFYTDASLKAFYPADGFGMPSGHAQVAATMWPLAAFMWQHWRMYVLAVVMFLGIGYSRIYLHVHSTPQVLVGWLVGLTSLIALIRLEPFALAYFNKQNWRKQLALIASFLGLLLTIGSGIYYVQSSWQVPELWVQNFEATKLTTNHLDEQLHLLRFNVLIAVVALLGGYILGAWYTQRNKGFAVQGSFVQKLARVIIGFMGLLPIVILQLQVLKVYTNVAITDAIIVWICSLLPGLWIAGIAPLLFQKLRLAKPTK